MHDWNCRLADFAGPVLEPTLVSTAEAMHLISPHAHFFIGKCRSVYCCADWTSRGLSVEIQGGAVNQVEVCPIKCRASGGGFQKSDMWCSLL